LAEILPVARLAAPAANFHPYLVGEISYFCPDVRSKVSSSSVQHETYFEVNFRI